LFDKTITPDGIVYVPHVYKDLGATGPAAIPVAVPEPISSVFSHLVNVLNDLYPEVSINLSEDD
jgi:hypothetical protein